MCALRMIGLFAIAALTMSSLDAAQTMAQPRLQQHKAADQSRSGVNCDWNMGACDMLQAYVNLGGKDPMCRSILDRAVELERCITKLGFKGVMINGYTQVESPDNLIYLDDARMTPLWEALTALDVP